MNGVKTIEAAASTIVLEGDEAEAVVRMEDGKTLPCIVTHPDAGGSCWHPATMVVYGLPFCEVHGPEAKAGALEELYSDAGDFLERLDNPYVTQPNPAALGALREATLRLDEEEIRASADSETALRTAYPLIPERMDEDISTFDYEDPDRGQTPDDWFYRTRFLLHKLMRLAHEEGELWLVEVLEEHRESASAQLAFVRADLDKRYPHRRRRKPAPQAD